MKLDKEAAIPLYLQVEQLLEEKIRSGEWTAGIKIPPESELANQLQVSNITVKRAIMDLVNKGLLYRQRGKGTFVIPSLSETDIHESVFFSVDGLGRSTHQLLDCTIEKADTKLSAALGIKEADRVYKIKRLGIEDGKPVSLEYTYIPHQLFPDGFIDGMESELIYHILKKKFKLELTKAKSYFSAIAANKEHARLLNIEEKMPLFVWERITHANPDLIVEYSIFIMLQDKEKYYLEVSLS